MKEETTEIFSQLSNSLLEIISFTEFIIYVIIISCFLISPMFLGSTRYLSATIQNEMIECLGTKLENHLLDQIRASPFFTIIMDTTQDISKVDQLSIVVRYAVISRSENGQPIDIEEGRKRGIFRFPRSH